MRWNPRRRQVTSVVYVRSNKPAETEKPKSPWNSLEIAKIAVGAMTPLLIASIGVYVTIATHSQDAARIAREDLRSRKATATQVLQKLEGGMESYNKAVMSADNALIAYLETPRSSRHSTSLLKVEAAYITSLNDLDAVDREAWGKLRYIVDDEARSGKMQHLYKQHVISAFVTPSQTCIRDAFDGVKRHEDPTNAYTSCRVHYQSDPAITCMHYVVLRLENFDVADDMFRTDPTLTCNWSAAASGITRPASTAKP